MIFRRIGGLLMLFLLLAGLSFASVPGHGGHLDANQVARMHAMAPPVKFNTSFDHFSHDTKIQSGLNVSLNEIGQIGTPDGVWHYYSINYPVGANDNYAPSLSDFSVSGTEIQDFRIFEVGSRWIIGDNYTFNLGSETTNIHAASQRDYVLAILTPLWAGGQFNFTFAGRLVDPVINSCGTSLGAGAYTLSANLNCATGNGVTFTGAHTTFDLSGFNFTGQTASGQIGIDINANDVNISNSPGLGMVGGWVYNWTNAAIRFEAETANNGAVTNVSVSTNQTYGIDVFSVSNITLTSINATAITTGNTGPPVSFHGGNNGVDNMINGTLQNSFIQGDTPGNTLVQIYWITHSIKILNNTITDNATATNTNGAIDTSRLVDTINVSGNNITTTGPRIGINFQDCYLCSAQNNRINITGASIKAISLISSGYNESSSAIIKNNTVNITGSLGVAINLGSSNLDTITNNTLFSNISDGIDILLGSSAGLNAVYWNNFTGSQNFISNTNVNNTFNTTVAGAAQGNIYGNISKYRIYAANGTTWGSSGADYPANGTNTPGLFKSGSLGNDSGPFTNNASLALSAAPALTPAGPNTTATLSCKFTGISYDYGTMNYTLNWYKNGANQTSLNSSGIATNNTLVTVNLATAFTNGDNWSCNASLNDTSNANLAGLASNNVTIWNITVNSVSITPATPNVLLNLSGYANISSPGFAFFNVSWTWFKDGVSYLTGTTQGIANDTNASISNLTFLNLTPNDNWSFQVQGINQSWSSPTGTSTNVTDPSNLNSCQNLTAPNTVYTMVVNLTSNGGTCFNVTAAGISILGGGFSITGNNTANAGGVNVTKNTVSVYNLSILNMTHGIIFNGGNSGLVNNVTVNISGGSSGVYLPNSNLTVINNSNFNSTANIALVYSDGTVSANNITVANSSFWMNSSTAPYGIYLLSGSINWTVFNNTFTNIDGNGARGIIANSVNDQFNTFSSNTFLLSAGTAAAAYDDEGINQTFANNTITDSTGGEAILLSGSANASVINNTITTTGGSIYGIYVNAVTTNSNVLNLNNVTTNGVSSYGIYLSSSSNITVANNTVNTTAVTYGIALTSSANNTLTNNTVTANVNGFVLNAAINNTLINNTVTNSSTADFNIGGASVNNTITNNTVNSSASTAFLVDATSGGNTALNNTFISKIWVNDANGTNKYNNTNSGNLYYFTNGSGAWTVFSLTTTSPPNWATSGTARPLNATNAPGNWTNLGADWFPWTGTLSFSYSNGTATQTLTNTNQSVQWTAQTTVSAGSGTCTYNISQSAAIDNTTILNSSGSSMVLTNTTLTNFSWACTAAGSVYNITFYTENITQVAASVGSALGTNPTRFNLTTSTNNAVQYNLSINTSACTSEALYLCTQSTLAACDVNNPTLWTNLVFNGGGSALIWRNATQSSNETTYVLTCTSGGGTGGGSGSGGGGVAPVTPPPSPSAPAIPGLGAAGLAPITDFVNGLRTALSIAPNAFISVMGLLLLIIFLSFFAFSKSGAKGAEGQVGASLRLFTGLIIIVAVISAISILYYYWGSIWTFPPLG